MTEEKKKKNRAELLKILQNNPNLPIVFMVDGNLALDDFRYWRGALGGSSVERYVIGEEAVHLYDENDMDDCLYDTFAGGDPDDLSDEARLEFYRSLPWKTVIVVYVMVPDPEDGGRYER